MNRTPITKVKKGIKVKIVEIKGTKLISHRLSTLGLRSGACVTKLSSFALKGPITLRVGSTTIALGHSMAEKVLVDPRQGTC